MLTPPNPDPRATRERTMLAARLSWGDGAYALDANVTQISRTGARLSLSQPHATPGDMQIDIPRRRLSVKAQVVRREGQELAVRFLGDGPAQGAAAFEDRLRGLAQELAQLKGENLTLRAELRRLRGG